jgi:hypothetical protein
LVLSRPVHGWGFQIHSKQNTFFYLKPLIKQIIALRIKKQNTLLVHLKKPKKIQISILKKSTSTGHEPENSPSFNVLLSQINIAKITKQNLCYRPNDYQSQ